MSSSISRVIHAFTAMIFPQDDQEPSERLVTSIRLAADSEDAAEQYNLGRRYEQG